MTQVDVDRFRSTFVGDQAILTAELEPRPAPHWRSLCLPLLERYASVFGSVPDLIENAIVVSVLSHEIAMAEAALRQIVTMTNWLMIDPFDTLS